MKKDRSCGIKTSIGGQALVEGIMMRGPKRSAMAVRNLQGEMVIEEWDTKYSARNKFCKLPVIRGVFGFIDSMSMGYKCLMRSAEISGLEELEAEEKRAKEEKKLQKLAKKQGRDVEELRAELEAKKAEETEKTESGAVDTSEAQKEKKESSVMMTVLGIVSGVFAVILMVGLFILLPTFIYEGLIEKIPGFPVDNRYLQSAFEGVLRVALLIGYMALMTLLKDIRRTFQFHGAEHKTIFCYEAGLELTVENVKKQKRFHPRCGTSFLMLMVLVSILVGFFIPPTIHKLLRIAIKILLIPVIMGIGYELIKLCGKYDNALTKAIAAPGKWFQRITVLEPDDGMIECAIAAINKVIPEDGSDKIQ